MATFSAILGLFVYGLGAGHGLVLVHRSPVTQSANVQIRFPILGTIKSLPFSNLYKYQGSLEFQRILSESDRT